MQLILSYFKICRDMGIAIDIPTTTRMLTETVSDGVWIPVPSDMGFYNNRAYSDIGSVVPPPLLSRLHALNSVSLFTRVQ
jgi:hypothetical protein